MNVLHSPVRRSRWGLCVTLLLLGVLRVPLAYAEEFGCVGPSEDVVSAVMIRAKANTNSAIVSRLAPGDQRVITGEVPYWYRIVDAEGEEGFVSKRWTNLEACPGAVAAVGGEFEVHAIDVGTGLSVFVRGPDFALLYDAGSNDDLAKGDHNRVLGYLHEVAPTVTKIDHVVLSHPHRDHVELMADVFSAYEVGDVWNSGRYHEICGYRFLLRAIAAEPGVRYHTALFNYGTETVDLDARCSLPASQVELEHGARLDGEEITLGNNASMRFLYIDGTKRPDPNDNSLVVLLTLGGKRVLLMGDAGGGGRALPSVSPKATSVEGILLSCCANELRADVMVIGHHGSMTSSRALFLDKVGAKQFIISSGPFAYSGTVLPDAEVVSELEGRGLLWRTDIDDDACAQNDNKIGEDSDDEPGGCNNVVIKLSPGGIQAEYRPH